MSEQSHQNHFLASLSKDDEALLRPHLRLTELARGGILYGTDDEIKQSYFPLSGIVSIVVGLANGEFVEAGMVGRNSVVAPGAPLDRPIAFNQAIGQVQGFGMSMPVATLREVALQSPTLRQAPACHEHAGSAQTQQIAVCNAVHGLEERLSRWLLQARDLVQSTDLPLTHEYLAQMLGVQRSSVTLAACKLREAGLIHYRRGLIEIRDPVALQDSSCECYAAINRHFCRILGWSPSEISDASRM